MKNIREPQKNIMVGECSSPLRYSLGIKNSDPQKLNHIIQPKIPTAAIWGSTFQTNTSMNSPKIPKMM
ncbi:MAG: hypothetical protein WC675_04425 [Patescibacteria group bacterium]